MIRIDCKHVTLNFNHNAQPDLMPGIGPEVNKRTTIIDNVSFNVKDGEKIALQGKNGSGKTTLLRLLAAIYIPDHGKVFTNGKVGHFLNLGQGLRGEASVSRNIQLNFLLRRITYGDLKQYTEYVFNLSGLRHYCNEPVRVLSAGMKARLAFALATFDEPEILLLDEWVNAGDSEFRQTAQARLRELTEKAGSLVIASHNSAILKDVCNSRLVLDHGKIVDRS